jgi:hypothetical protein
MQTAFVVRGKLKDPKTIELDEPVGHVQGPVEVTLRPIETEEAQTVPLYESLSPEEFTKYLHDRIASHDPNLPILPAEALRRESMYEEKV